MDLIRTKELKIRLAQLEVERDRAVRKIEKLEEWVVMLSIRLNTLEEKLSKG